MLAAITAAAMVVTVMASSVNAEPETNIGKGTSAAETCDGNDGITTLTGDEPYLLPNGLPKDPLNSVPHTNTDHSDHEWKPLTSGIMRSNLGSPGDGQAEKPLEDSNKITYYYLTEDIDLNDFEIKIQVGDIDYELCKHFNILPQFQNVVLCLNGHTLITYDKIEISGTFTLCDCKGENNKEGEIKCNKINVEQHLSDTEMGFTQQNKNNVTVFNMYSGTIGGGTFGDSGSGRAINFHYNTNTDSEINIYGGTIIGFNEAIQSKYTTINITDGLIDTIARNAIYLHDESKLYMSGGTISKCKQHAVNMESSTFTISGGLITDNKINTRYTVSSVVYINNSTCTCRKYCK